MQGTVSTCSDVVALKEENNILNGNIKQISDEFKKNMRQSLSETSALKGAMSDIFAAWMDWMPRLRHTDDETARAIAVEMRWLRREIEERLNG